MAPTLQHAFSNLLTIVALFSILLVVPCSCLHPKMIFKWLPAVATWYGPPQGPGSEGGACGYANTVGKPPFSSLVSAGSPLLYQSGKGCGSCYEVKCTGNDACSGKGVRVVITDECAGCAGIHFDLSGTAFGAMAVPGQGEKLRNAGKIDIQYRRVECSYPGVSLSFKVDPGSNEYYVAMMIEYEDGIGELDKVELKDASSPAWHSMDRSWGAVYKLKHGSPLKAPFSVRLTTLQSGDTIVANNVIPGGWKPGQIYKSAVNF